MQVVSLVTQGKGEKFRLGNVIGNTAAFLRRNAIFSIAVGTIFFALPLALINLSTRYWPTLAFQLGAVGSGPWSTSVNLGFSLASGLIGTAPNLLGQAVLSQAAVGDTNGNRSSVARCVQTALRHIFPVVGIGYAVYLAFFLARSGSAAVELSNSPQAGGLVFLFLMIPCVVWGVGISVAVPVSVREGLGTAASMSRSQALTKGYRWWIFGLVSVVVIGLLLALRLATAFGLAFVSLESLSLLAMVLLTFQGAMASAIVWTVLSIVLATTYAELRRVKEGPGADELAEIFS
ncbi:hypothetical protein AU467_29680 [Mesorhizobium loti]|uniref:Glycerophosphoryl diester phosphodiesterase membrane domain-containing protein n=1 Tax=Rhizobium loti TaxID=381 RepID=A0A101KPC3_RHILI|nr:hypothetical protein AU467_29680 [Mesorhizobium loti]